MYVAAAVVLAVGLILPVLATRVAAPATLGVLAPPGSATNLQISASHDGAGTDTLPTPLHQVWAHDFPGAQVGYSLLVNGRVFVMTNVNGEAQVYALHAGNGAPLWGPVDLGGSYATGGLTADGTHVYMLSHDGLLTALDQATGKPVWSSQLPGRQFPMSPTAANGLVYVTGGDLGDVYAVNGGDGTRAWTTTLPAASVTMSAAVTTDSVYLVVGCLGFRLNAMTGWVIWTTSSCGNGADSDTEATIVHGDRVYGEGLILSTATGQLIGTYGSSYLPTFDGDLAFFLQRGSLADGPTLLAVNTVTGHTIWTQAGVGGFATAPVVVDGNIFIGDHNNIEAFNEITGRLVWSGTVPQGIGEGVPPNGFQIGLAEAASTLLVPASGVLLAYGSDHPVSGLPVPRVPPHLPPLSPASAPVGSASAYEMNATHDGSDAVDHLPVPLHVAWRHDFGAPIGYPLMVNGRVFVLASGPTSGIVDALDAVTGALLWTQPDPVPTHYVSGLAADGSAVYSLTAAGTLSAYAQTNGTLLWSMNLPGSSDATSPPVVVDAVIYIAANGANGHSGLYAVDAANGAVLWERDLPSGDASSPAVSGGGVFVSYVCNQSDRIDATTGALSWNHPGSCSVGGHLTPVVHNNNAYVTATPGGVQNAVLSAATGTLAGSFNSMYSPAFDGNIALLTPGPQQAVTLTAVDTTTGAKLWSQVGNGHLTTSPIVVDHKVIMGSTDGTVTIYDTATGAQLWSDHTGQAILNSGYPILLPTLAEANSTVLVPSTNLLTAYVSDQTAAPPAPTPISSVAPSPQPAPARCQPPVDHAINGTPTAIVPHGACGYWVVSRSGQLVAFGDAPFYGDVATAHLTGSIVAMAATPDGGGYWLAASDGGIFSFGDARFYGSAGPVPLNKPIVGMAATPDGGGYWLVAADGGIFTFGDARFRGSAGAAHLNASVIGMARTKDGGGYWLAASDGGIFTFGDAAFSGSMGSQHLDRPVVGVTADYTTGGYRLVGADGRTVESGVEGEDAAVGAQSGTVNALAASADDHGYWTMNTNGKIQAFGNSVFFGNA